ncbi:MAG: phosphatase PAP2 family protein [Jatrophihabitantaceae bacterium]
MQNLQLGWQPAAALSAGLFAGAAGARLRQFTGRQFGEPRRFGEPRFIERAAPYLREAGVVAALYTLWQLACSVSVLTSAGAFSRARWIVRIEQSSGVPSERGVQRLITGHSVLSQSANWYYAAMHFASLGALLLWLFARHRQRYPEVRNVLVLLTASSLLIQLLPVAPPRLLPELGFVDTAARYGQSVYNLSGVSVDQLAAMPSVHVGWALLIAWAVLRVSASRHRWWMLAHPVLTVFVVAATANHFWLDGIVAAVLLALSIAVLGLPGRRLARSGAGMDDGDAGRSGAGHGRQRRPDLVQADHAGD